MRDRNNNFDFVRFVAAFFVIYGHCQVLDGVPSTQIAGLAIQGLGVLIFFSLSGYLVTNSLQRNRNVLAFLANRSLRVFPALAMVVTLTTYVLGPAMTTLNLHDYFQSWLLQHYMKGIALYVSYTLPGVFENNTYPVAVNGSLWSLPAEFLCYLIVAGIGLLPRRALPAFLGLGFLVTASLNLYLPYYKGAQIIYYSTDPFQWAAVAVCFFVGALYSAFRVPLRPWIGIAAAGVLLGASWVLPLATWTVLMWIGMPYLILSLGVQSTPVVRRWGRFGDASYGMYLYSFPITQTIIALHHNRIDARILIVEVTTLSVGCALLSWHLLEKWALKFKLRGADLARLRLPFPRRPWRSISTGAQDEGATAVAPVLLNVENRVPGCSGPAPGIASSRCKMAAGDEWRQE
jgi:peptidoglycan/LPS O-acetylase OafA/YrhL